MKTLWQVETEPFVPRIGQSLDRLFPAKQQSARVPRAPFSAEPSEEQQIAYSLALFAQSGIVVIDQLLDNVGLLWSQGRMVGISGLVRFSLEYWGAVYFGHRIMAKYRSDGNLEDARYKTARLTFGAKTPVTLPWGGQTTNPAYSVLTFIDKLVDEHPDARQWYDFLSEASHPNFLQNSYLVLASKTYESPGNEILRTHAHGMLEQIVSIIERVADGVVVDATKTIDLALPLLEGL